ncbi:MAG: hypothetical protein IPK85_03310 [Gemmatimonadetes bacterium]|nr:hypothetical protein [Gemmatimonadota bacterium]
MARNSAIEHPQVKERVVRRFKDRHGRVYEATIDIRTNQPISRMRPMFKAPWHSDRAVLVHNEDDGTSAIDLREDVVIAERKQAHKEWEDSLTRYGLAMHGEAFNPAQPTAALLRVIGPKPEPVEYALAAKKGDPWILGNTTEMPVWAKKLRAQERIVEDEYAFLTASETDPYGDIEEQVDPQAIGGKRVPVKSRGR